MTFTAAHATLLLPFVGSMSVAEAHDKGLLEAITALIAHSKSDACNLIINCHPSRAVEAIKAIRMALLCGLKEAKDMYDGFDPLRNGGQFVLLQNVSREVWAQRVEEINNDRCLTGTYFILR